MARAAAKTQPQEDFSTEFVVGSRVAWDPAVRRTDGRDRVEQRLDKRTLQYLRLDAEIESDIGILADSVFADGGEIVSAITDEADAEFELAAEIATFVEKATCNTARPLDSVLKEMFKAAFYNGVKIGEIVLKYQDDSQISGKLVLDRINPKPISATAFVTDRFYNVLGLIGAKRVGVPMVMTGSIVLDKSEIIPRDKFLVMSFELEDNDPRGLSQVRSAYEAYCDKQTTRAQWKEWRRTSAIPKKFATTPEGAKEVPVKNEDGTIKVVDGKPVTVSAQANMMAALDGFANNSALVAPAGATINQLEVNGKGEQFQNAITFNNSEIRKVILGDALMTGAANKDSRAARESSKDVNDMKKQALRDVVQDQVKKDIFKLLTVVNYGPENAHLTPNYFLGDTEANDWATDVTAASSAGYAFDPAQFAELDVQFGLTPRENAPEQVTPADPNAAGGSQADNNQEAQTA